MQGNLYGEWPSPISAKDLAQGRLRLGEGFAGPRMVCWLQSNPTQRGRTTLLGRKLTGGQTMDLTSQWDLRTSIHEYGGTPVAIRDEKLCFYDRITSRVWAGPIGGSLHPITDDPRWVYGGFTFLDDDRVVCVREDHSPTLTEPEDSIVVLNLATNNVDSGQVIAQGSDFYFCLAVAPTGWIAWTEYDHPGMPWDSTRIIALAPDGTVHQVANSPGVSALHPQWAPDGSLVFLSDQSGYWNFYRWADGDLKRLHDHPYDFCEPPWGITQPPYALIGADGGAIGCSWWQDGLAHLGVLGRDGVLSDWGAYGSITLSPAVDGRSVVKMGSSTTPQGLSVLD